jgi:hypothetical protein
MRRTREDVAEKAEAMFQAGSIHEAAHAVVALYYGAAVREIQLEVKTGWFSDPRPNGNTWVVPGENDPSIPEGIVITYAGPEAEAWWWHHYHGISIGQARGLYPRHAASDLAMIGDDLARFGGDGRLARELEREAEAVVSEVWGSIISVAEALRECNGFLTGGQVLAAV